MSKRLTLPILTLLIAGAAGAVFGGGIARPICMEYAGWITDSETGKDGANVSNSRERVEAVLARGGQLLFYSERDGQLIPVADPIAALEHVGRRLTVDAHVELVVHSYSPNAAALAEK